MSETEPVAMTLSHDRLILNMADVGTDAQVVVVRCPHMVGLTFDTGDSLANLPCPCNEPSTIVARVVPVEERAANVLHPSHRWGLRPELERTEPGSNRLRGRMIPCCLACLVDGYEDESDAFQPCRRVDNPASKRTAEPTP